MVPVHAQDQCLLRVQWGGNTYIDTVLPFGLRSAPKNFSAVADALQWILVQKGLTILHYLDDFILVSDSFKKADAQKQLLIDTFKTLGVPLETSKLEGPATCLTFLGIEFDTVNLQIRLPRQKLSNLKSELTQRRYLSFCTSFHITPLPTTEATLCYFIACLGQQGLAHSTIRTYLSGIRQFQIAHGYKELNFEQMLRLCQIIKGVKITQGQKGRTIRPRLPITP